MNNKHFCIKIKEVLSYEEKRDRPIVFIYLAIYFVSIFAEYNFKFFDRYFYNSYGFYANAFIGLILFVMIVISHRGKLDEDDFFLMMYMGISAIYYLLTALVLEGGFRYTGVVFVTMAYTLIIKQINISKRGFKFILFTSLIALVLYANNANGYFERQFITDLTNSNYIGLLVISLLVFSDICMEYLKERNKGGMALSKAVRLCAIILCIYIVMECRSRASLISLVFYLVCRYMLPKRFFKTKKIVLCMLVAILAVVVVFPFIYIKYSELFDIRFLDRSGLNRYNAWYYVTTHLNESISSALFGHGTRSALRIVLGYPAHNTFLQTWYDTGIVGLLLVDFFTLLCVKRAFRGSQTISNVQAISIIGLMALLINDSFGVVFTEALAIWEYSMLGMIMRGKNSLCEI